MPALAESLVGETHSARGSSGRRGAAGEGSAFQIGSYDTVARRVLGSLVVPIRRAADGE